MPTDKTGKSSANNGKPPVTSSKTTMNGKKRHNTCFVISPFGGWYDRYLSEIYGPGVKKAGLEPKRADDLYRPSAIVHDIWSYVKDSRVMLADLTGKNPNVFYELGLAHAAGKPVVLLTQDIDDVPFDLRALRVIEYDVEDPEWGAVLRGKITKALQEVMSSPEQSVLPTFLHGDQAKHAKGSKVEKQVVELQRQVNLLSAENRSLMRPDRGPERDLISGPDEARIAMRQYIQSGMPSDAIIQRLSERGVPLDWVHANLRGIGRTALSKKPSNKNRRRPVRRSKRT